MVRSTSKEVPQEILISRDVPERLQLNWSPRSWDPWSGPKVLGPLVLEPKVPGPLVLEPKVPGPLVPEPNVPGPLVPQPKVQGPLVPEPKVLGPLALEPLLASLPAG